MTRGTDNMECDILDEKKASYLARRIAIEDIALKYSTSLRMAEKLLRNNIAVAQISRTSIDGVDARAVSSKASEKEQNGRGQTAELEEMEVDSDAESREASYNASGHRNHFPTGNDRFFDKRRSLDHSHVTAYLKAMPRSNPTYPYACLEDTHFNDRRRQINPAATFRPFIWPYYAAPGYNHMALGMYPRGYPFVYRTPSRDSQSPRSRGREVPLRVPCLIRTTQSPDGAHRAPTSASETETLTRPSQAGSARLIAGRKLFRRKSLDDSSNSLSAGTLGQVKDIGERLAGPPVEKTLLRARSLDDSELMLRNTRESENGANKHDVILTNSHRPSVLVMQSSSQSSSASGSETETRSRSMENLHEHAVPSYEHCTTSDDHEETDSNHSTPPSSPSSGRHINSSDERFSSDSPRSGNESNKDKPHKCHICGRAFRKHSALIIHHRVHSGEKPYKCHECSKQFSISGNLRRHLLIHTGERPYVCPECSRAFNNPSHLTRHRRKLHSNVKNSEQS